MLASIHLTLTMAYQAVVARLDEMTAPVFVLFVTIILVLERLFPTKSAQKILSVNAASGPHRVSGNGHKR